MVTVKRVRCEGQVEKFVEDLVEKSGRNTLLGTGRLGVDRRIYKNRF